MNDAYYFQGLRANKGTKEFTYSEYNPRMNIYDNYKNNNVRNHAAGYYEPLGKPPSEFNDTIFRSTLKQVLPIKGLAESVVYGRPESDKNAYMYPQQGYARGQELGLASDADKPINGPIAPISGFYDIQMVNVFGNLK